MATEPGLYSTSFEQRLALYWPSESNTGPQAERREKAAPILIELMGALHAHHPDYVPKPGMRQRAVDPQNLALLRRPILQLSRRVGWLRRLAIYYMEMDR